MKYQDTNPRLYMIIWFRTFALILTFVTLMNGCTMTTKESADDLSDSTSTRSLDDSPSAEEIWWALARSIHNRRFNSSTELAQIIVVLGRNDELSKQDVVLFDSAFPGLATASRDLTDADAQILLRLAKHEN